MKFKSTTALTYIHRQEKELQKIVIALASRMKLNWFHILWSLLFFLREGDALMDGEELKLLQDGRGFIEVNDDNYNKLSQGIEDYYSVLFITISDNNLQGIECAICRELEETVSKVLSITRKQSPATKVLFFRADVTMNSKLLADMSLTTVPHVLIFPPPTSEDFKWSVDPFYQYNINDEVTDTLLHFGDFFAQVLDVHLELQGFDYGEFLKYFSVFVIFFIILKKQIVPRLPNAKREGLMLVCFAIILTSICGYKFTQINAIPFIARDGEGKIMYFSGGTGWQFGIEIFSVSMMYVAMGGLTVLLIYAAQMPFSPLMRDAQGIILACFLFLAFGYYIQCYKIKLPDYPFGF